MTKRKTINKQSKGRSSLHSGVLLPFFLLAALSLSSLGGADDAFRLDVDYPEAPLIAGKTYTVSLSLHWTGSAETFRLIVDTPDLENLQLIDRGQSLEAEARGLSNFYSDSVILKLKALRPGTANIRWNKLEYIKEPAGNQTSLYVEAFEFPVRRPFAFLPVLAVVAIFVLGLSVLLARRHFKILRKKKFSAVVCNPDNTFYNKLAEELESLTGREFSARAIKLFVNFLEKAYGPGIKHSSLGDTLAALEKTELVREDRQRIKALFKSCEAMEYGNVAAAESEVSRIREEMNRFIRQKIVAEPRESQNH